ncbi:zinc finger and SCAN domain-containing protein 29-like [Anneissia japonica]|uniref:zinc finger and SCAN domain-containing protein 29-like n=1 Tax=Anneissia japonica TaxID=1529436 RepID=UPI0014259045|nr:zinc finger and SCAN domain-containing protein 29-like [Anneissia japonica]
MAAAEQCGWTDESTQTLISIWGTTSIQDGFDGTRRNNSVYKEIAQKMREMGYNFTHAQIVTKCKNLRKKYTQEKDSNGKSGNPPTEWPYFEMLNDIFGDRPISCPPHTIDTSLSALNTSGSSSSSTEMMANLDLSGSDVPESTQGGASASSVDADLWRGAGSTVSKRKRNGSPLKKRGKKNKTKADTIVSGISNMLEESTKKFEESFFQQQQLMLTEQFKMEEEMQER